MWLKSLLLTNIVSPSVILAILVTSQRSYWNKKVKNVYKDELFLKNVFVQIFSFLPLNHYGHRASDCKPTTPLAVDMPSTRKRKKKPSGTFKAHKELVLPFFVFGSPNILFVCLYVFLKRLECFLFDLQVFKERRYWQPFAFLKKTS